MDDNIATFLAFTATEDTAVAKQFLELSGNNVEYAVQLFMESGTTNSSHDADLAQRLQQEAYQDNVREADTNVHRHETLQDSFGSFASPFTNPMTAANAIFGRGRTGVFNQRFEELDDEDEDEDPYNDDDYDNDEIDYDDEPQEIDDGSEIEEIDGHISTNPIVVEIDLDSDEQSSSLARNTGGSSAPVSRRARRREDHLLELNLTQRRLADLFKPPFDIMSRISLDDAKIIGRRDKKWILVNIQDQSEFQCQVLNRDFWSNADVKHMVKENFVFLQYQVDSPWGEMFSNFYHVTEYPYICILDPLTGERVRQWPSGLVPDVTDWLSDVELFLEKFSLGSGAQNPHAEHEVRFDPDAMSEEQQLEYALRQSVANEESQTQTIEAQEKEEEEQDPFKSIQSIDHEEPSGGSITRVQVRFPTGKRLVHKFDLETDKVLNLYQWLKFVLSQDDGSTFGIGPDDIFQLSCVGRSNPLIESLEDSIGQAGLKNASVLVEKC
ncbi:hypothetical protein PUMCH_002164 [Australozyma saopauloensis]|uniref:UBX domain-containing protein n=1 Tax=Australozyma saopauloensis TaxID=291208 RepID=A0AAX4H8W5_9ASCO|nr:hypothetical protein PUMCH_002164 [[Candida] saopauloensis]